MPGVLSGLEVLDLSWGIAGPAVAMLLADHGADVTRVERPEPGPFEAMFDSRVHHRGQRSAVLDLKDPSDRARFLALAAVADVLIESFSPGTTRRLGIDYETLRARNPRLVYCSITGYGRHTRFADRPAYDQLVAARAGYQWELRAWPGSPADIVAGRDMFPPDTDLPAVERHWFSRGGPVFTATPAPSISAAYLATLGISGAIRARELTGRGQWVETSLLQGIIAYQGSMWQRSEHASDYTGRPAGMGLIMNYAPGATVMSGPWSLYECSDGRWVNAWTSRPEWAILAGSGDELRQPQIAEIDELMAETGGRTGTLEQQLRTRLAAVPIYKKFPQAAWVQLAAEAAHQAVQPVRSPEEVRNDPGLIAEGAVVEVVDPELGALRQAGVLYRLHRTPGRVRGHAPRRGEHTAEVRAEADALAAGNGSTAAGGAHGAVRAMAGPLAGVVALDFGLAVAGPWGGELLAQLGADVIKVDPPRQNMWLSTNMAMKVNRSKRHLSLDVKKPDGLKVAYDLVRQADVVLMNMRPQAARKLGLDYESLQQVNPSLVYCRTRGFDDSRAHLPGNDQTGNAVGGTEWEDGGVARGGRPYWSAGSGGDLGNGYLSAIGMVQALYHRDRTGEGQEVDTSILNAALFSTGSVFTDRDGRRFERPTVDPDLLGLSALYRLYECREGWLCLGVFGTAQWDALVQVIPVLRADARFATAELRRANDEALSAILAGRFRSDSAEGWFKLLDEVGVPCEVSSIEFSEGFLDDPEMIRLGWAVSRTGQRVHGRMEMFGRVIDFSDTRAEIGGPPAVPGQHSREILHQFGYTDGQIDGLVSAEAVFCAGS
jgi:crotonobetainyl-CoA:carnitine CoA-transferase CaiB-like acyl-CoA transferase